MFIQVIQSQVLDEAGLRGQLDRWRDELAPKAEGWLGTTAGLPVQGGFIAVFRFESEDAARRNSELAAQDQWWTDTAQYLDQVSFHDCRNVDLILGDGGSDEAGFVQVIQGRTPDPERLREIGERLEAPIRAVRPEIVGGTVAWHDDGAGFTQTVYFSSEAEARAGERRDPPDDVRALFEESQRLVEAPRYFDLPDPWLWSR
jgi:hypothetical protein